MTPRHGHEEHGDWDALATAYALSALEPDEEARFVPHLATCVRCTETVREATRTVGDLAYAVPDEEPPPALKQRLMTAVALAPHGAVPPPRTAEPDGPERHWPEAVDVGAASGERPGTETTGTGGAGPGRPPPPAAGARPVSGPDHIEDTVVPLRRRPRWQRIAAAAAVVAALAGLGVWNAALRADQQRLRDAVAQRQATIDQFTREGPVRIAELEGDGTRMATLVVRPGSVEVISEAMPANDAQSRYWLWAMDSPTDPAPAPIAGFDVRSDGLSVRTVRSSRPGLDRVADFAVSVEPGSTTPTRPTHVLAAGAATG